MRTTKPGKFSVTGAFVLILFLCNAQKASAQQTWTGNDNTNDWSDPANWTSGVPTSNDDVTIPGFLSFYPVLSAPAFAKSISMASATSLTTNNYNLTITNSISGTGTMTSNGSIIKVGGDFAVTAFTGNSSTDTIRGNLNVGTSFTGSSSKLFVGGNCSTGTTFIGNSAIVKIVGDFNVGTSFTGGNSTDSIGGDFIMGTSFTGGSSNVQILGNFYLGTTFTGSLSTVTFSGASAQSIGGDDPPIGFNNLVISNVTAGVSTSIDIIPATTKVDTLANFIPGSAYTVGGILSDSGTIQVTAVGNTDDLAIQYFGTLLLTKGKVDFVGVSSQEMGTHTVGYLEINNSSGVTLTGDIDVLKNLTGSGTLIGGTNTATIGGDMTVSGFTCNTSTVIFNGAIPQVTGTGSGQTFYNLTMDNTNGGLSITGHGSSTVSNLLTLTSGIITSDASDPLIFSSTATAVSGGSNNSYINGPAENNGLSGSNPSFTFPVGSGGKYAPAMVSGIGSTADFTAQYFKGAHTASTSGITGTSPTPSVAEYWTVIENSGGTVANLTLNWEDAGFSGILSGQVGSVSIYNDHGGSTWVDLSGTPTGTGGAGGTGSVIASSVAASDFASGGYFTFGDNSGANPLPVTLISFNVNYEGNQVEMKWTTASETNNDYFSIERSINGQTWQTIGQVPGHGNSMIMENYAYIDGLEGIIATGNIYYRLKQVDFNGVLTYSQIRAVDFIGISAAIATYPNPATNLLNVNWISKDNGPAILNLTDMTGKTIYTENVTGIGMMNKQIDMTNYPKGAYTLWIVTGRGANSQLVCKK